MKTRISTILGTVVLPFVLFSCSEVTPDVIPAPADLITINASIPQDVTRVAAVVPESGTGLDWNWQAGDNLAVISGDNYSIFDIRSGFEPTQASFIGKMVKGDAFSIIYPGEYTSEAALAALSLGDQMQVGNNATDHLKYFALLSGVDSYEDFTFSEEWAGSHGGSLKQCGVIRFTLTLPAETATVSRISLKSESPIFHKGNDSEVLTDELSIGIAEGNLGSDHTITAWLTTSWFDDVIPAGTPLTVNVAAGDLNWVCDITPTADKTIKSGCVNKITLDDSNWASGGRYAEGEGTQEDPWIIKSATQLTYVRDDMVAGETRYFKLGADINMEGIEWAPLNNADPYDKFINFDGDGHIIYNLTITEGAAYASFAGVLYGTLKNVTFSGADITGGSGNKCGIVAGYVGTASALTPCEITNVTVKNSVIHGLRSMGAFAGQVATDDAVFTDCHVINTDVIQTATSTSHAGGFVGYSQKDATYVNCTTDATVQGTQFTGGFGGYLGAGHFDNCSASGSVSGTKDVGGFVGKSEIPVLTNCWYDGPGIKASDATKNAHPGGFIGYAAKSGNFGGVFTDCYVKETVLDASAGGQRAGGFVGQADAGNTFTKCYVKDVDITAGQNSGGFVGVDYATPSADVPGAGIYQCYVEGGSLIAGGANCGGFVGYPEGAKILNSYTTIAVDGGANASIGGFIGICNKNVTVQYCYAAGTITGTSGPIGSFVGKVAGDDTTHINYCIAWNDTLPFEGQTTGGDISGNYAGTEGTLAAKAAELGWDPAIWDFAAKLR